MQEPNQQYQDPTAHTTPKSGRRKILKYTLVSLGVFIGFILLSAILIPLLFENQIKGLFIRELNKNLATEVSIKESDIDLNILRHFPEASIVFHNVGIRESVDRSNKNFLQAEEISLLFNFRDIIRGQYNIHHITMSNGFCHLITDKKGHINYHFWKESESTSSEAFSLNLEKVDCSNIDVQYIDYRYSQDIALLLHDAELKGNFSSDQYTMSTSGSVLSKRIHVAGTDYLINKEADVDTKINIDVPKDEYAFEDGSIEIDHNVFALNGFIRLNGEDYYDLTIDGKKINLEGLMLLLPGEVTQQVSTLQTKGDITFNTTIKGNYSRTKTPAINIHFDVKDGSITHPKFGGKLDDIVCTGAYSNGAQQNAASSSITLNHFSAQQDGRPVTMQLNYKNFSDPVIDLQLNGRFPASLIIPLAMKNATDVEGMITLNDININGRIKALSGELSTHQPTGSILFEGVAFTLNKEIFSIPKGIANVSNNTIYVNDLNTSFAGSDLALDLEINNWIESVFPAEYKPPLHIDGTISSKKIDLSRIIDALNTDAPADKSETATTDAIVVNDETRYNFSGQIALSCDQFLYDKMEFGQISAELKLTPGLCVINNLKGNGMGGQFALNTTIREIANGDILMEVSGILQQIDVTELFFRMDNFDQSTVTDKNIKGKLSANLYNVSMKWNKNFVLDDGSIYTECDMKIENGELNDCKPLESLSGFVKMQDLKHITFSTLENKIEIRDRMVKFPAMKIESSALDLYMSGSHSFANAIDYQFRLSMADLMVRKFLGSNKQSDNYEEDAEGGINVYISMTGTVDDPVIAYNKREAKQKLKESGLEEQKFIDIFKRDPEMDAYKKEKAAEKVEKDSDETEPVEFIDFDDEK